MKSFRGEGDHTWSCVQSTAAEPRASVVWPLRAGRVGSWSHSVTVCSSEASMSLFKTKLLFGLTQFSSLQGRSLANHQCLVYGSLNANRRLWSHVIAGAGFLCTTLHQVTSPSWQAVGFGPQRSYGVARLPLGVCFFSIGPVREGKRQTPAFSKMWVRALSLPALQHEYCTAYQRLWFLYSYQTIPVSASALWKLSL